MLTLESAKSYLKIDFDDMDEDIANLIMEAEAVVFASTGILAEEVERSNNDTLKNLYNITVKIVLKNLFDEKEINGARLRAFYLKLKPLYSRYVNGKLGTSQYVALADSSAPEIHADEAVVTEETDMTEKAAETKQKPTAATKKQGIILLLIQLIIYTALGFLASSFYPSTALVYGAVVIGTFIAITYAKKQLGGMSGDIAGYGIVWGEFCGVAMLVFC